MATGYFLVADLLGFGAIMRNLGVAERAARIAGWTELVDSLASQHNLERVQLISDTLFIATDDTTESLGQLIRFGRSILATGIARALPVRGAIAHGEFEWGRLTYGPVVVRAHELEMNQNWIGIACDPNLPRVDDHWGFESLICYAPPFKSGPVVNAGVVDWAIPAPRDLSNALARDGLTVAGEAMTWAVGEKLNNTLQFAAYKALLPRIGREPRFFWGMLPMDALTLLVTAQPPAS